MRRFSMLDSHFKKEEFKKAVKENVKMLYRKTIDEATQQQIFQAVSLAVKDVIIDNWLATQKQYEKDDPKIVYYLSMEFLMGRALGNNLINLTAYKEVKEALDELGFDLNVIEDQEPDPALGNGGLGRLAACFLDSLATLGYCAYGCGIRYHYGLFKQKIEDGYQIEVPDNWLKDGYPFELRRPEYAKEVKFGGYVRVEYDAATGRNQFIQEGYQSVMAIPYDMPIVGYNNKIVNTLRIWDAEPITDFRLDLFDKGEYHKAVEQENLAKNIVEVLYPNDNHYAGKELRLKQQYFFISASIQEAIAKFKKNHDDLHDLPKKVTFQLNDTHPTMTVAELMRILLDEEGMTWEEAWDITTHTCAYTNHTIMAEALEKWPRHYLDTVVPQLMPIIEKLDDIAKTRTTDSSLAIIDQNQVVHMAHMDIHFSHSTNGVATLHTQILKESELAGFYQMYPEKFNNKTNGITFRRWLEFSNQELADYIKELIGDGYLTDATQLEKLAAFADDPAVHKRLAQIKYDNKLSLKRYLKANKGIDLDENSIIDTQIKRFHEYKRQQMNALYVIHKYLEIKKGNLPKRKITIIFGGKAAPAYVIAQDIIHLILSLSELINNDPEVSKYLNVHLVENYNVTVAEHLIPATDISEQISLASKEASGTGKMKFMLNGALTLGTMDGANVEIAELVGPENIFTFGKDSDTIIDLYEKEGYVPRDYYEKDANIKAAVDFIVSEDLVKVGDKERLERLHKELISKDWFMTLIDLAEYIDKKEEVYAAYEDQDAWNKKVVYNIAEAGFFSSDRTIEQYDKDIWHTK